MNTCARIRPRFTVILSVLFIALMYLAIPASALADDTGPVIGGQEYKRFDQYVQWSD